MKSFFKITTGFLFLFMFAANSIAADLTLSHTDAAWTGDEVPDKGKYIKRGAEGMSPPNCVGQINPASSAELYSFHYGDIADIVDLKKYHIDDPKNKIVIILTKQKNTRIKFVISI